MKTEIGSVIFIVLVLALSITAFFDEEPKEIKCKGEVVKGTDGFHKNMKACKEEFTAAKAKGEPNRKRGYSCMAVCALTKDGIFDAHGMYVEAKMNSSIDASLSSSLAAMNKEELALCAKTDAAAIKVDEADKSCKNYKPWLKCMQKAWMKTCMDGYDPDVMEEDD